VIVGSTLGVALLAPEGAASAPLAEGADGRTRRVAVTTRADDVVVLARHGSDPRTPAHRVDHHANIRALAAAGCDRILGLCSVGSLRVDLPVGSVVVPDDVLALGVAPTYHLGMEGHRVPCFDEAWRAAVLHVWRGVTADAELVDGGTYAQTQGPRFETPAEIRLLADYADVVGMTMASELFLAGDLGLPYAGVCTVDNLANGLEREPLAFDDFTEQAEANAQRFATVASSAATALASGGWP
jgi:5'-methylthioadenosine phosphorylase